MRKRKVIGAISLLITLALLGGTLLGLAAFKPASEMDGYGSVQTVSQQVFTTLTTQCTFGSPCTSATVRNVGQSQHTAVYCLTITSGVVLGTAVQLEGSFDGATWFAISDPGQATSGCSQVEAGGYYPNVRVNVRLFSYTSVATMDVWYSGTSAPISNAGQASVRNRGTGSPIFGNTQSFGQAYAATYSTTNPALGQDLGYIQVTTPSQVAKVFLDKLLLSSTAAATVTLVRESSQGTSCAPPSIVPLRVGTSNATPQAFLQQCGTAPATDNGAITIMIPANQTITVDLSGYSIVGTTGDRGWGLISPSAQTAVIKATWQWFEQ